MRCPNCGSDNPDLARFCHVCGSHLPATSSAVKPPDSPPASTGSVMRRHRWPAVIAAAATAAAVIAAFLYLDARGESQATKADLTAAEAEVETLEANLDGVRDQLQAVRDDLAQTRSDLRERTRSFGITSRCLLRLFDSWYDTTRLSYTATGLAFGRAVFSAPCRVPRLAYEST
jgi:hypothetical protein